MKSQLFHFQFIVMFVAALGNISILKVNAKILYDTIELGLYEELMDFNNSSGTYGLAQAAGLVKDGVF